MPYVVRIDESVCAAHGDCAVLAPDVFRVGEVAELIGGADDGLLMLAAEACPSLAITLIESETGEQAYP
jgi:ferredoxin